MEQTQSFTVIFMRVLFIEQADAKRISNWMSKNHGFPEV
jgi:hypothetical protein